MLDLLSKGYERDNWGDRPAFPGDFMNLGYWEDIDFSQKLTEQVRTMSAEALYRLTTEDLAEMRSGNILELGFGKGGGLFFLAERYPHLNFHAADAVKKNFDRVSQKLHKFPRSNVIQISNELFENINFGMQFDALVSVEALQHINDIPRFFTKLNEALRVGGTFMACAHMAKRLKQRELCLRNIPFAAQGNDVFS